MLSRFRSWLCTYYYQAEKCFKSGFSNQQWEFRKPGLRAVSLGHIYSAASINSSHCLVQRSVAAVSFLGWACHAHSTENIISEQVNTILSEHWTVRVVVIFRLQKVSFTFSATCCTASGLQQLFNITWHWDNTATSHLYFTVKKISHKPQGLRG